jgi:hypothetical protein
VDKTDLLSRVGRALYGAEFKSQLARALGVTYGTVARWCRGREAVPSGVWREIGELVDRRLWEMTMLRREIRDAS